MIYNAKILVLHKNDLVAAATQKSINDVDYDDIPMSSSGAAMIADLILFFAPNGETKILKNRWGGEGTISNPPTKISWTTKHPKQEGFYWVKVRGELSGRVYDHIVKVYEAAPNNVLVFYDGDNYRITEPRFMKWSTVPINPPVE